MDIVLTFEFCHDITIWKMTAFDTVDYFEIEPVGCSELHRTPNRYWDKLWWFSIYFSIRASICWDFET